MELLGLLGAVVVAVLVPLALDIARGRITRRQTMDIEPKPTNRPRYLFWD